MKQKLVFRFPANSVELPFTYHLIKDYNLMVNILKAHINPRKEGRIVVEVSGEKDDFEGGLEFLRSRGVKVFPLEQEIAWIEERCTQCGACCVICPTGALHMKRPEMEIEFLNEKCIVCEHCLKACPARAVEALY